MQALDTLSSIKPHAMPGLKKLAKAIKHAHGISHNQALDLAARQAGYESFIHASRQMAAAGHGQLMIYVTAYWRDRKIDSQGSEQLLVPVSQPLSEFMSRNKFDCRFLANFKLMASDHIERPVLYDSQSTCRTQLAGAARTLQFIDATGMTPSKGGERFYPGNDYKNDIPGSDHTSYWTHAPSKTRVIVDEPYLNARKHYAAKEAEFERIHGFTIRHPEWPGMYNVEGGCRLRLAFNHSANEVMGPLLARLDKVPFESHADGWKGTSTDSIERFISPAKKLVKANKPAAPRKAKAEKAWYTNPNGRMSLANHRLVGKALSDVLIIGERRAGIRNPLRIVRNELDNWLMAQPGSEVLDNTELTQVHLNFYRATRQQFVSDKERMSILKKLNKVDALLAKSYEDGRSLHRIRKLIGSAIRSATNWK